MIKARSHQLLRAGKGSGLFGCLQNQMGLAGWPQFPADSLTGRWPRGENGDSVICTISLFRIYQLPFLVECIQPARLTGSPFRFFVLTDPLVYSLVYCLICPVKAADETSCSLTNWFSIRSRFSVNTFVNVNQSDGRLQTVSVEGGYRLFHILHLIFSGWSPYIKWPASGSVTARPHWVFVEGRETISCCSGKKFTLDS